MYTITLSDLFVALVTLFRLDVVGNEASVVDGIALADILGASDGPAAVAGDNISGVLDMMWM
jgi:hypothetical protein